MKEERRYEMLPRCEFVFLENNGNTHWIHLKSPVYLTDMDYDLYYKQEVISVNLEKLDYVYINLRKGCIKISNHNIVLIKTIKL